MRSSFWARTELTGFLATDGVVQIRGHNSLLKERHLSSCGEGGSPKKEGAGEGEERT